MLKLLLSATALAALSVSAFAADMPSRAAPAKAPAPVFTWTGFYAGVNAGYAGDTFRYPVFAETVVDSFPVSISGAASVNSSGFLGGAQVGYNWQLANGVVVGVEADYALSSVEGKLGLGAGVADIGSGTISAGSELSGLGTVRARLGYGMDRTLVFVTGGWAYGKIKTGLEVTIADIGPLGISSTDNLSGWTVGAGVEYAITNKISFKTEYLYADLGSSTLYSRVYEPGVSGKLDVETKLHIVRAGVNYRF